MESFSFKIGTPKPVYFREYDLNYKVTDVDLEARIAMNVEVTDFDGEKYKDASEAEAAVKADKEELFQRSMFSGFSSEKIYYAPGEDVEVIYSGLMTDTSYTFYVTVKDHKVKYDDRNFYRISFVMPNHDVEVTCGIQSVMTCNYGADRNVGMMGLGAMQPEMQSVEKEPMPKLFTPKQPDEWFCTECGQKNKGGEFCRECGTKKYENCKI